MAGHSKFKNIMHRKGRQDAVRSKLFSRLSKEITVAVKMGAGIVNPDMNPRLRTAIHNAKGQSMPKENIQRAISKGAGGEGEDYKEIRYEGYGPGGVAMIVEALTDNVNRSASNIRTCFTKNGGQMGESGSVAFMFDHVGEILYNREVGDEDAVMEAAIEAGAEDVSSDENNHVIICRFEDIGDVAEALENILGEPESVKPIWKPQNATQVNADKAPALFKMMEALEDEDDVQNIYSNFEIDDEIMAQLTN